jgi:predicted nucleotidyltransferase
MPLDLEPENLAIVHEILQRNLPDRTVWAFGSRATGRHVKRFSDLDLAVEGTLSFSQRGQLRAEFGECLLPMKVDINELGSVDASFRERIEKDFVPVQVSRQLVCASQVIQRSQQG